MKAKLSAIGLGALIASACTLAVAGPTVTITQQGSGNTAYADQETGTNTSNNSAIIVQVGTNNHAGDPTTLTGGIVQHNTYSPYAKATILQNGEDNNASILQDLTRFGVPAIQQTGNNNTGAISQVRVSYADATLQQSGNNNVATLEQTGVADLSLLVTQTGNDNRLSYRESASSYGNPSVTQTGAQNSVTVDQDHLIGTRGVQIEQIGDLNTVTSTQKDGDQPFDSVLQVGNGNTVVTNQLNGGASSFIVQTGDRNLATVTQSLDANDALITQTGNDNSASVTQTHLGGGWQANTAYITQIGDGFTASITQSGYDNHAGIYQH